MSGTGTRTSTVTATFAEQVLRVTRNVQTDLLELVDMYGQISVEKARNYIEDFRAFMRERYLDSIEFYWTVPGTSKVVGGLEYTVVNGDAVRTLDRAGGIAYDATVATSTFHLLIDYSGLWDSRSEDAKSRFKSGLRIQWVPASPRDYSAGRYVSEGRTYGQPAVAISRKRFERK